MSVGLEVTGQQGGFISLFKDQMLQRNTWFTIAKGKGSSKEGIAVRTNKMDRFRLTEPFFKQKKIFLPEELKDSILIQELLEELSTVTIDGIKSVHDDALDMVSQLDQMYVVYPSAEQNSLESQKTINSQASGNPFFTEIFEQDGNINTYLA